MNYAQPSTGVSTQEEADNLIILVHAAEISKAVYILWPKTQMLWSLLFEDSHFLVFRQLCLWEQVTTEEKFCWNQYMSVLEHQKLQHFRDLRLFNRMWHMWTYWCIGKKTAFKAFTEATPAELTALSQLGVVEMPSADVVLGCESFFFCSFFFSFLCRLLGTKKTYTQTQLKNWGGSAFRANLGIDKIPHLLLVGDINTPGVHAAAYVWSQTLWKVQIFQTRSR